MCGIVGMFGFNSVKRDKVFKDMLQMDVVRGPHSTGVAFISSNISIVKDAVLPTELIDSDGFQKGICTHNQALIGHNRWATQGEIVKENAHPFRHKHITGVHNGTVFKYSLEKLEATAKFETDSETIINAIAEHGIEDVWKKINGAAALVWWDNQQKTLNIIRNKERNICFAYSHNDDCVYFASEEWLIKAATERNGEKAKEIMWPKEHILFTFTYEKGTVSHTARKLDPYVFTYRSYNGGGYGHWENGKWVSNKPVTHWEDVEDQSEQHFGEIQGGRKTVMSINHLGGNGAAPSSPWPKALSKKQKKLLKRQQQQRQRINIGVPADGEEVLKLPFMQVVPDGGIHSQSQDAFEKDAQCFHCNAFIKAADNEADIIDADNGFVICGKCAREQREEETRLYGHAY